MAITLHTIAAECGVDVSTVSRALRNDKRVKPKTCELIQRAAKKLGYSPNLNARFLQSGKTRTIWLIIPSLKNSLDREIAEHASEFLIERQYDMLVALYNHDPSTHIRLLERLEQGAADAAIIIPSAKMNIPELERLVKKDFPLVFIDRHYEELAVPVVTNANFSSSQRLVELCHEYGAEEFIVLHEALNPAGKARLDGSVDKLESLNCPYQLFNFEDLIQGDLIPKSKKIAILASGQYGLHSFLTQNRSVFIDKEIVIGTYDYWHGEPDPAEKVFTCVQDFRKMAEIATNGLMDMLEKGNSKKHQEFTEVPPLEYKEISRQFRAHQ